MALEYVEIDPKVIRELKEHNVDLYVKHGEDDSRLFIKNESYGVYLSYLKTQLKLKGVSKLQNALNLSLEILGKNAFSKESLAVIDEASQIILNLSKEDVNKEILSLLQSTDRVNISVLRTLICRAMAFKMGWTSPKNILNLLTASLFCDIFEGDNHHQKANEYLKSLDIGTDICLAVFHHHEKNDGSGPIGLKKFKIHPLSKVISVCDLFCSEILKGTPLNVALYKITEKSPSCFDSEISKKMFLLFKKESSGN